ncbi:sugar ABC transporter permease [Grimontia sp. AD028]|uniref:Various polyols ABC transporter, permease component 1 n=2 Tax=Grimontia TaxID=246861 RepID=R1GTC1_9GAMM|nr:MULTISPECIES: sugar ABC transporter permease [Grimontia]EOD79433.1 Various polyols ABC transporter, permease component 1 [Grimontia indica]KKD59983.1 sugar ABC transporter permease [Grimontia sp. AD028]NGN99923.1 sugar ABC transporter permease [Grimontia sedimenti]
MQKWLPRLLVAPSFVSLLLWMIVPLSMTIYFSTIRYNLLYPGDNEFIGSMNFEFFYTDEAFWPAIINTLTLVGMVLVVTVIGALIIAIALDKPFFGRGIVRVLLISPFFIMPTVNALIWKNMMMHPVYGVLAALWESVGLQPVDWLEQFPLGSIIAMISWQWMPFALLIFITSLQSMDHEQKEAALLDGATGWQVFRYLTLPHLARPIAVVMMIETIFMLSVFAEIFVTTGGGPGYESTNLAFLIFGQALMQFDVGVASAGGLIAVILANIVAFFLIRAIGKNLVT